MSRPPHEAAGVVREPDVGGAPTGEAREARPRLRDALVFDCETVVDRAHVERVDVREGLRAGIRAPSNYRDPDAIARYVETTFAERVERGALSPLLGKLIAIGLAELWSDDEPVVLVDDDEQRLLTVFSEWLHALGPMPIAGFNTRHFDCPFVTVRAALHEVTLPTWWPHARDYRMLVDAQDVLGVEQGGRLSAWLARFGLPPKSSDGSRVGTMSAAELARYCGDDVASTRLLLRKLAPAFPTMRRAERAVEEVPW